MFVPGYGVGTMTQLASEAPVRRSQEQRRTQTRRLLLEATVASLCELGYSGTTTLAVEKRAGVSRGARIHHFESKAALLAAAGDYLYEQLSDQYAVAFADPKGKQSDRQRLRTGLHMLWTIYQRPHYTAVLELHGAARKDAELKDRLSDVAARHRELALQASGVFFPGIGRIRAQRCIETIHAAFVGMCVQGGVTAEARQSEYVLSALEDLVLSQLKSESKDRE